MTVKSPLGLHQLRWLKRIRSAGGIVELEPGRNANHSAWIPIEGGNPIQIPMRMFESLVERDLLSRSSAQLANSVTVWRLLWEGEEDG